MRRCQIADTTCEDGHIMRKALRFLVHRIVIVVFLLLVQILALFGIIWYFNNYFVYFYGLFSLLSIACILIIVNDDSLKPGFKLAWIIPISIIPIFGNLLYLLFGNELHSRKLHRIHATEKEMAKAEPSNGVFAEIERSDRQTANQSRLIMDCAGFQPYQNTSAEYLPSGEAKFERLKEELQKAKRFIFIEYFIISEGFVWDSILSILSEKARQGLDVRILYDDLGSAFTLPHGFKKNLSAMGIKCNVFNPFVPILSSTFNHRDHRKIVVIDGHTAFTGGINLADEYINKREVHGHWKDASILIKGEAVHSFTLMFLAVWNFVTGEMETPGAFLPEPGEERPRESGFVQPFSDSYISGDSISEAIYLNLINKAGRYIYIVTPYLIIDTELITALSIAAKSGVDVRIVTPHIGNNWYVHSVTRSNYEPLIKSGVRIFEYTPGFIHAKLFVVDDQLAVIGTVNLDYRSLYMQLECGVWLYKTDCVRDIYEDYLETLSKSQEISLSDCQMIPWHRKLGRMILRVFAPMM